MEIEIFTLCDFAQDVMGKMNIIGTFDTVHLPQFPFVLPLACVAIKLRFGKSEEGEHNFKLQMLNTEGTPVFQPIEGNFNFKVPPQQDYMAIPLVFNIGQMNFTKPEKFAFELYIDGEWVSGLHLNVVKAQQPGQQ